MHKMTRRKLLGSAAAAFPLSLVGNTAAAKVTGVHADTVVRNGKLLTMDENMPHAEAMAIQGHHILAVGSNEDIANLIGPNTRTIDAAGMTVTPGFIDAHSHPVVPEHAVSANVNMPRIADVKEALRNLPIARVELK